MTTQKNLFKYLVLTSFLLISLIALSSKATASSDTVTVCANDPSSERDCQFQTLQAAVDHIHITPGVTKIRILSSLPASSTSTVIPNAYPGRNISFICSSKANVVQGTAGVDMIKGGSLLASYRFENCTYNTANAIIALQGRNFTLINNNFYNGKVAVGGSTQTHTIERNMFVNAELIPGFGGTFNIYNNVFKDGNVGISISQGGQYKVTHNTFDSFNHAILVNHGGTTVTNSIVSNTYSFITRNSGTINSTNTLLHKVSHVRQGDGGGTDLNLFKGNPSYIDSELRISSISNAVGKGLVTEVIYDRDGNKRDDAPDLGAYEVQE